MKPEKIKLEKLPGKFTVCKVRDLSGIEWEETFLFLGKTDREISVVCREEAAPQNVLAAEEGWKAFRIQGNLDFSFVGILARISAVLAENQISIFAVSTYDTDYILVRGTQFVQAVRALEDAGYFFEKED